MTTNQLYGNEKIDIHYYKYFHVTGIYRSARFLPCNVEIKILVSAEILCPYFCAVREESIVQQPKDTLVFVVMNLINIG
jgi:hypothetical protein